MARVYHIECLYNEHQKLQNNLPQCIYMMLVAAEWEGMEMIYMMLVAAEWEGMEKSGCWREYLE